MASFAEKLDAAGLVFSNRHWCFLGFCGFAFV